MRNECIIPLRKGEIFNEYKNQKIVINITFTKFEIDKLAEIIKNEILPLLNEGS